MSKSLDAIDRLLDEEQEALAIVEAEDGPWSDRYRRTREEFARRRRQLERELQEDT